MQNIQSRYDGVAKFLHWTIALLIISEYLIGLTIDTFGWKWLHIQVGFLILLCVLLRVIWRITHQYPAMDASLSKHNQFLAHAGHGVLYLLMLAIPLTGVTVVVTKGLAFNIWGIHVSPLMAPINYDTRHMIKEIHEYMAHIIIIMAALHALAALMHQFVHGHKILSRMLPTKLANIIEGKHDSK
jgi:cytochrome b561